MRLASLLAPDCTQPDYDAQSLGLVIVNHIDELVSHLPLDGILLPECAEELRIRMATQIVHHDQLSLIPLVSRIPCGPILNAICHYAQDWRGIQEYCLQVRQQAKLLQSLPLEADYEEKLLRWLFLRPEYIIEPLQDSQHPQVYTYPLLAFFQSDASRIRSWILSLQARSIFDTEKLADKIRLCAKCGSGHINFFDRCPNCKSIDIAEHDFLHCFTCGHVAPEEDFLTGNHLICPKCRAALRHIGTDYDRPMENQKCADCGNVFSDSEVVAGCFDCGTISQPGSLETARIYRYRLSDEGRISIRNGALRDLYAIFDKERFATRKHFEMSLEWIGDMYRRYGNPHYSMVHFTVQNVGDLVDTIGRPDTVVLLEEFNRRLRAIMRETDIPVRIEEHRMAILMPSTSRDNALTAINRLANSGMNLEQNQRLNIDFGVFAIPGDSDGKESAKVMLGMLLDTTTGTIS